MPTVDSITRTASKLLLAESVGLDPVFPPEVDDGYRWGLIRLLDVDPLETSDLLVGVPIDGLFTADDLVDAVREGLDCIYDLEVDDQLEIGLFRFEIS